MNYPKKYIRNRKNQRVGIVLCTKIGVGWSLVSGNDKWNPVLGEKIAVGRANCLRPKSFPARLASEVTQMEDRRKRYFQLD